jgi:RNA polymerase sigma-70 factor (ECF subfamily)
MRSDIEQALTLLKASGEHAAEEALALLQDSVFAFSMRVCGQREDAEDTMQEVLLKSLPYLPKFESSRALAVWLYKVAKNRCLMSRRKSKFAPQSELSLEELMPDRQELERLGKNIELDPERLAIRGEQAGRIREAIQKLPPPYRIVLVLRDMENLADDEVAEITGLRPGTVRVRLHRARLFLRKELMNVTQSHPRTPPDRPSRPGRCKAIFAQLSNYLDDEIDPLVCEELQKHLADCEPCRAFLRNLEAIIERCRKSPAECPDRKSAASLRQKLLSSYRQALAAQSK